MMEKTTEFTIVLENSNVTVGEKPIGERSVGKAVATVEETHW